MTVDRKRLFNKPEALRALLLEHSLVRVCFDARVEGVVVPPPYKTTPDLGLDLGLNMPVPVHDLSIDEDAWSATLSFNRIPFFCVVPWPAVFAILSEGGYGAIWEDDVPREVILAATEPEEQGGSPSRGLPPGWRVLDGGKNAG